MRGIGRDTNQTRFNDDGIFELRRRPRLNVRVLIRF